MTSQPIQRHPSLPDALGAAAERADAEDKKVMVLVRETATGDLLYATHPMNTVVGPGDRLAQWRIRYVVEAR